MKKLVCFAMVLALGLVLSGCGEQAAPTAPTKTPAKADVKAAADDAAKAGAEAAKAGAEAAKAGAEAAKPAEAAK